MLQDALTALSGAFVTVLNRSLIAGGMVPVILLLRLLLRRSPKWVSCLLWGLVAVELACPMWLTSPVSVYHLPVLRESVVVRESSGSKVEYFHYSDTPEKPTVSFDVPVSKVSPANRFDLEKPAHTSHVYLPDVVLIWLVGVLGLTVYSVTSFRRLRRQTAASLPLGEGVCLCDDIDTPFILGIVRPKIFLPSRLSETVRNHVIAHEKAHLQRRDHWWKPLGFALLTVYWFNPVLWLAYVTLCRDIELACDERVCGNMETVGRRSYAEALLLCSIPRGVAIAACPLAFGEVGVKERVKAVAMYKRPAFWAVLLGVAACIVTAVCFLTRPSDGRPLFSSGIERYSWECSAVLNEQGEMLYVHEGYVELPENAEVRNFHVYAADGVMTLWDWQLAPKWEWRGTYKKKPLREFYTIYDAAGEVGHAEVSTTQYEDGTTVPTLVMTLEYDGETRTFCFDGAAESESDENGPNIAADIGTEALRAYFERLESDNTQRRGFALHYLTHGDVPTRTDYENGTGLRTIYGMAAAIACEKPSVDGEDTSILYSGPVKLTVALDAAGDWTMLECDTEYKEAGILLSLPKEIRQMVNGFDSELWTPLFDRARADAYENHPALWDEDDGGTAWMVPLSRYKTVYFTLSQQIMEHPYLKANFHYPVFRTDDEALETYLRKNITEPLRDLHMNSPLDESHLLSSAILQDELTSTYCSADEIEGYFWYREDYQYLPFGEENGGEHCQTWLIDPVSLKTLTVLDLFPMPNKEDLKELLTEAALKNVQKLPDDIQWENVAFCPKEDELLLIFETTASGHCFEVSVPWSDITLENNVQLENLFGW